MATKAYGITIYEFFDKSSFLGKTGKLIGGIIVPSVVGYGISKFSVNIYSKNAKIRLGILLLTMLAFVVRELFDGKVEYTFTDTLEKIKPNIFFLAGTLLNLIFHPVSDD